MMSIFQELTQPGIAPIIGAAITAAVSINTLFLKWLIQSFRDLRIAIDNLSKYSQRMLDDHEKLDQARHEQNLQRFENISVRIAQLGNNNGNPVHN